MNRITLLIGAKRGSGRTALVVFLALIIILVSALLGMAETPIKVNSTSDDKFSNDGLCTLREAIIAANTDRPSGRRGGECRAGSGPDTIMLPAGTYLLERTDNGQEDAAQTGDLDILDDLIINGAGAKATIIQGLDLKDRIVHAIAGTVTINGVTIRDGNVPRDGGGVYNSANLTLVDVVITDNKATLDAGGVFNEGTLKLESSAIVNNSAPGFGGGLLAAGGQASLVNVTISGNSSQAAGGGVLARSGQVSLNHVTVGPNTGNGNVVIDPANGGSLNAANSILAGQCLGDLGSLGYNLIEISGCTVSGNQTGNLYNVNPMLDPLADYGGSTPTHRLKLSSPAVNSGDPAFAPPPDFDQRGTGFPRVVGGRLDIGAYEFENPPQAGPAILVNKSDDHDDGFCTVDDCTLREAINAANNSTAINAVGFSDVLCASPVIKPLSALPAITEAVTIDGFVKDANGQVLCQITLDGSMAGAGVDGLTLLASNNVITGLEITGFDGNGISISPNLCDTTPSINNTLTRNNIHDNGGLGIDLCGDGRSENDNDDGDIGANHILNFPVLKSAVPDPGQASLTVKGLLNSEANKQYTLEFFGSDHCAEFPGAGPQVYLGSWAVTTNDQGDAYFTAAGLSPLVDGQFVTATATDAQGSTSEVSDCISVGPDNTIWFNALTVPYNGSWNVQQYIDRYGQSRWYKVAISPTSRLSVTLSLMNVNADLNMTVYKDIGAIFSEMQANPPDLDLLGAEFSPELFSPELFSPELFSPELFSPELFSPELFSPELFSPELFSPELFSPELFSPELFSPELFSADAFAPELFSPELFSPELFSPELFSPELFSPEGFSIAQLRALVAISAERGTADEKISLNTFANTGYYYIRIRGLNGQSDKQNRYLFTAAVENNICNSVLPITTPRTIMGSPGPFPGGYKTLILMDSSRFPMTAQDPLLVSFAQRPEVSGAIIDVGTDAKVAAANAQADIHFACPYAKNLVVGAVKEIVDDYWAQNSNLSYIVLIGNDNVLPYERLSDLAQLANESRYVVPVGANTSSQASLRHGFILGQDSYGSRSEVAFKSTNLPIADLAVGRLVENLNEVQFMLQTYLSGTQPGTGRIPTDSPNLNILTTGYDFLADAATAVTAELELGAGTAASPVTADTLISPYFVAPRDTQANCLNPAVDPGSDGIPGCSWSADDLRAKLLNPASGRIDIAFLGGHFSAGGTQAADYQTRMTALELANSSLDITNAFIFSVGCHSGYNTVDAHGIPFWTEEPDWARAFNGKGATLIAGTGFQYGDSDLLEYSERLYLLFSQELRTGTGPVSVGQALVNAKNRYLATTPQMRGIHHKVLVQATIFGFPMLSVDMQGQRLPVPSDVSEVGGTSPFLSGPAAYLGLEEATLNVSFTGGRQVNRIINTMDFAQNGQVVGTVETVQLVGEDGSYTNPGETVLPLDMVNATVPGMSLRGVGIWAGSFTDEVLPADPGNTQYILTGAPTWEIRGVHAPFLSDFFYPVRVWQPNYYEAISDPVSGATRLALTPAQVVSKVPAGVNGTATLRIYNGLSLRLFYSNNLANYPSALGDSVPCLSAPPHIVDVSATLDPNNANLVNFTAVVAGNPAAGVQEVWITYSGQSGPFANQWQSLSLMQQGRMTPDKGDDNSTVWVGSLNLGGTPPGDLRYLVQAVNGCGLTSLHANFGEGNVVELPMPAFEPTSLTISAPASGAYATQVDVSATLVDSQGSPVAGETVRFRLGSLGHQAVTDASGTATANFNLVGLPGTYTLRAAFDGSSMYKPSSANQPFVITKQKTQLTLLQPAQGEIDADSLVSALLQDILGRYLGQRTVIFEISNNGTLVARAILTAPSGQATLGSNLPPLPAGTYTVRAIFQEDAYYEGSMATGTLIIDNSAPVGQPDVYNVSEDTLLTVAAPGVLGNDTDPNGDTLSAVPGADVQHGTLTLNGDGSFSYMPDPNFNGMDSFTYFAHDGLDSSAETMVIINVGAANDAPVANPDVYQVTQDSVLNVSAPGVLANDSDVDGDSLTAVLESVPSHGSLALNADGSFIYTPAPGYTGSDSFQYRASDGSLTSGPATVSIAVKQANMPPVCDNAFADPLFIWSVNKSFVPIQILGVTDPDGDPVTILVTAIFQDEPVGKKIDGMGVGTAVAEVRAERLGNGDGRVYHISFTASDGAASCNGDAVTAYVPHDQSLPIESIDQGPLYDSTIPD